MTSEVNLVSMNIKKFEDLIVWQKAKDLNIIIHNCMMHVSDYGYKNQIERASLSIMNNIAEDFDRQTTKEYKQFLHISMGSCSETKSMLYLGLEYKYFSAEQFNDSYALTEEINKMLHKIIQSLELKITNQS